MLFKLESLSTTLQRSDVQFSALVGCSSSKKEQVRANLVGWVTKMVKSQKWVMILPVELSFLSFDPAITCMSCTMSRGKRQM